MEVRRPVRDLRFVVFFPAAFPESMGHWDSLLLLEAKQRPKADLSKLHCKSKMKELGAAFMFNFVWRFVLG